MRWRPAILGGLGGLRGHLLDYVLSFVQVRTPTYLCRRVAVHGALPHRGPVYLGGARTLRGDERQVRGSDPHGRAAERGKLNVREAQGLSGTRWWVAGKVPDGRRECRRRRQGGDRALGQAALASAPTAKWR